MGRRKKEDISSEVNVSQVPDSSVFEQTDIITITVSNGNITKVIEEALFLGKLGGKPTPRFLPRLKSPPYIIKADLTPEAAEEYASGNSRDVYVADTKYNNAVVRSPDPLRFFKAILEIGAKGGIIQPQKAVSTGTTISVPILFEGQLEANPVINVLPSK